jgi:hypothetical protein
VKPKTWILGIYPAIALLLLAVTVILFKDWWRISFTGENTEGRIKAVFFLRESGENALVSGVDTHLRMTRANGDVMELFYYDNEITRATEGSRSYEIGEGGLIRFFGDEEADKALTAEFRDVLSGKSDRTDWFLLRQKRVDRPEAIVRLEKTETAIIWEGLPEDFNDFSVDSDSGRVVPRNGTVTFEVSELVTQAIYSYEDEEALAERKGAMLMSYERRLDGEVVDEINREFVIYNEPYWTAQYPIFVFEANGEPLALKADIGRHGDPSLAFPLFARVNVNYLAGSPEQALMNGKISARKPGENFLNWFSRASEVYLTRWIYPGMFLFCTLILAVVSMLFISMATHPPKKLPPIPKEKESES